VTLKIFAYNVQQLDQLPNLKYYNQERAKQIANALAASDYDVLIFSEAFDNDARKVMTRILQPVFPYRTAVVGNDDDISAQTLLKGGALLGALVGAIAAPWAVSVGALVGFLGSGALGFITGRPRSDGGVFMMSRWPVQFQGQRIYRNKAEEDRFGRKGVSWAMFNKLGFYFNVFGTHTQADGEHARIRRLQFDEITAMYAALAPNWQPSLIGGDLNVDYCFDRDRCQGGPPDGPDGPDGPDSPGGGKGGGVLDPDGRVRRPPPRAAVEAASVARAGVGPAAAAGGCCDQQERVNMLARLGASPPADLSKFTYTQDAGNDLKQPGGQGGSNVTLDYVLHVTAPGRPPLRPQPRRSSLETVRLRGAVAGRGRDLSDHFGVLGTFVYPFVRDDSTLMTGTWKCIKFNGQPDTHNHRMTFAPFGRQVVEEFDGRKTYSYVHQIYPGRETTGRIIFNLLPGNNPVEYEYTFKPNPDFRQHFDPSEMQLPQRTVQTRPRLLSELFLRNAQRNMLYAFEHWPPVGVGDDFRPGGPV
jgi:hypothetical protein